tara:strand:- start:1619 stop:2581 length:963 start_codon:yes stop_codon:yes gene_type:complete
MGAYGGGGGFTPSPNNIPGPTKVGSIVADVHQMTGSVEIDGDLILNGSAITPGGGVPAGATTQIQYNDAGAFGAAAELTYDGSIFGLGNPVANRQMTIHGGLSLHTGSMIVDDGPLIVQSDPSSEWFSVGQRSPGWIVNNSGGGITLIASANDMGAKLNVSSTNTSVPPMAIGKYPASTANTLEVNSSNTDLSGDFFVIDSDGKVGIGVTDPDSALEVLSTTTQQKWSYDADSFATLTVADGSTTTLASGESGNIIIDAAGLLQLEAPATTVSNEFVLTSPTVPTAADDPGVPGQISWENGFVYVCVAVDTWQRAALSTF